MSDIFGDALNWAKAQAGQLYQQGTNLLNSWTTGGLNLLNSWISPVYQAVKQTAKGAYQTAEKAITSTKQAIEGAIKQTAPVIHTAEKTLTGAITGAKKVITETTQTGLNLINSWTTSGLNLLNSWIPPINRAVKQTIEYPLHLIKGAGQAVEGVISTTGREIRQTSKGLTRNLFLFAILGLIALFLLVDLGKTTTRLKLHGALVGAV